MTLSSIGLIQGRLFPKYIDQLQVFPDKTWKKEINILREIGFDYIELLWDKKKGCPQRVWIGCTSIQSNSKGLPSNR